MADSKQAPNHTENRFFDPNFTFGVPKSHKNPGVGSQIWENFPKKTVLFLWVLLRGSADFWMKYHFWDTLLTGVGARDTCVSKNAFLLY